jgi:hypothetical protein
MLAGSTCLDHSALFLLDQYLSVGERTKSHEATELAQDRRSRLGHMKWIYSQEA